MPEVTRAPICKLAVGLFVRARLSLTGCELYSLSYCDIARVL